MSAIAARLAEVRERMAQRGAAGPAAARRTSG